MLVVSPRSGDVLEHGSVCVLSAEECSRFAIAMRPSGPVSFVFRLSSVIVWFSQMSAPIKTEETKVRFCR